MESQPQNPEFRNNPESFHPCILNCIFDSSESINKSTVHICTIVIEYSSYLQVVKMFYGRLFLCFMAMLKFNL